jgi:hypothetical protein
MKNYRNISIVIARMETAYLDILCFKDIVDKYLNPQTPTDKRYVEYNNLSYECN